MSTKSLQRGFEIIIKTTGYLIIVKVFRYSVFSLYTGDVIYTHLIIEITRTSKKQLLFGRQPLAVEDHLLWTVSIQVVVIGNRYVTEVYVVIATQQASRISTFVAEKTNILKKTLESIENT